ncbi:MAG: CBS domain-containing protein, partial [Planctomycetales bacterium]|nr:CBS domain-containing protein [Planctomycetales bacterium]
MDTFFRVDPSEPDDLLSNFEPVQYASELQRALSEETVSEIESKPFLQIDSHAPVREAVEMLHDSGVSCLLVVDGEHLVGIFTERDVLEKVVERYARVSVEPVEKFMTSDPTIVYES